MLKFHALVRENAQELAELIVKENGKNLTEALADVAKGNETVEYACSLPQLCQGRQLQVSGQVYCVDRRNPLGVVASIVPFNFPVSRPLFCFKVVEIKFSTHTFLANIFISSWFHFGPRRLRWSWEILSFSNPAKRSL